MHVQFAAGQGVYQRTHTHTHTHTLVSICQEKTIAPPMLE